MRDEMNLGKNLNHGEVLSVIFHIPASWIHLVTIFIFDGMALLLLHLFLPITKLSIVIGFPLVYLTR